MQNDRIFSSSKELPRRSAYRNTNPLRYPKSHHKTQASTRKPYSFPSYENSFKKSLLCFRIFIILILFVFLLAISIVTSETNENNIFPKSVGALLVSILLFLAINRKITNSNVTTTRRLTTYRKKGKTCKICNCRNYLSKEYCYKCGAPLSSIISLQRERAIQICISCNCRNNLSNKFCHNCGAKLSLKLEAKRRKEQLLYQKTPEIMISTQMAKEISNKSSLCHLCGHTIDAGKDQCPKCGNKRNRCPICLRYLNYDDDIAYCFSCETNFHFSHLMEFVKMRGKCPVCKERLLSSEVIRKHQQKTGKNA